MKVCPNCDEENSDRARFCQVCATPLPGEAPPAREVRKVVTVLFTDVTGSTSMGEHLDPESLRHVMERFFDTMQAAIERHGGVVEKFIGDAVMAVFGIPRLHEDDPIRAVRAAAAIREDVARLNQDLQAERGVTLAIRTGITTGEVVAGDPSSGQRLVTGDTVNTAARLEQAAQPGEILLGEPTARLVRDAVQVEPLAPLTLKGKAEPVPAYRLVSVQAGAEAHARNLDSPMVGRDRELGLLSQALDRTVSERTSNLFTLLGPAGVGKSRLVLEFLERIEPGARILRGRCLSYGDGITFFPVAEAIRDAADISDHDSQEAARGKIEAAALGTDQAEMVASGVAELIGLSTAPVAAEDAFWAVRSFFESLARERPLVVVFDDIHWAEPAFLDLVEHIADWTREAPILLLCVARPELLDIRPGWGGGKMNATSILLEPLGSEQCAELIDNLLGAEGLPPAARSRILEAAEGNPLFVEEMLGMLIDDGLLRRDEDRWVASDEVARVAVPPTIQLLLAARLDRLDDDERAVAERASVEGKIFHRGAVVSLSPDRDRPQVRTRLLALARKELIRPDRATFAGEDAFRFRHLLIRDAAYQGMPKEARAELHLRFADWLGEQAGDRMPEYEDILGYHLEQAYRYRGELGPVDREGRLLGERAGTVLASAARRALGRDDFRAAKGLIQRALDLLPQDAPDRDDLRLDLVDTLANMGDLQAAYRMTEELREEGRTSGNVRLEALASAPHPFVVATGDQSVTEQSRLEQAEWAMRTLQDLGDHRGAMRASRTVGFLTFVLGQVDAANEMDRRRLEEALRLDDRREVWRTLPGVTGTMFYGSTPVAVAIEESLELLPLAEDSPTVTGHILEQLPALYAMQGRFDEARRRAEQVRTILQELGDRFGLAALMFWVGPMHILAGDLDTAEREFRESVATLDELGDEGFLSTIIAELGEVLMAQGKYEEAERCALRSRELGSADDVVTQFEWRALLARVLAERGELEEAERLAREAVDLGEGTDYLDHRASLWMRLGEVLELAGRPGEAADAVRRALDLFERKGNVVMAARAREVLAELTRAG